MDNAASCQCSSTVTCGAEVHGCLRHTTPDSLRKRLIRLLSHYTTRPASTSPSFSPPNKPLKHKMVSQCLCLTWSPATAFPTLFWQRDFTTPCHGLIGVACDAVTTLEPVRARVEDVPVYLFVAPSMDAQCILMSRSCHPLRRLCLISK